MGPKDGQFLTKWLFITLGLVLLGVLIGIGGCVMEIVSENNKPDLAPPKIVVEPEWYDITCPTCGREYLSSSPEVDKYCFDCEPMYCLDGVILGVKADKTKQPEDKKKWFDHLMACKQCIAAENYRASKEDQ